MSSTLPPVSDFHHKECLAHIMLNLLPGVGSVVHQRLLDAVGGHASEVFSSPLERIARLLPKGAHGAFTEHVRNPLSGQLYNKACEQYRWVVEQGVEMVYQGHCAYPLLLEQTHSCPPVLYCRGNLECLSLPQLAIVGSRNHSETGKQNAFAFASLLAKSGFAVTSGLALGVDSAAHRGALSVSGRTLAVMGTGIDQIYPRQHIELSDAILEAEGLLVSELPVGAGPHASHFPKRNRIISGLSMGVLVVEAALKSGSLITARLALEQNREVFAIPGSIHNPLSRGGHQLIRQGATLVETAADIVDELGSYLEIKSNEVFDSKAYDESEHKLTTMQQGIVETIGSGSMALDELVVCCQLDVSVLVTVLLELELEGWLVQEAGRYVRCK